MKAYQDESITKSLPPPFPPKKAKTYMHSFKPYKTILDVLTVCNLPRVFCSLRDGDGHPGVVVCNRDNPPHAGEDSRVL